MTFPFQWNRVLWWWICRVWPLSFRDSGSDDIKEMRFYALKPLRIATESVSEVWVIFLELNCLELETFSFYFGFNTKHFVVASIWLVYQSRQRSIFTRISKTFMHLCLLFTDKRNICDRKYMFMVKQNFITNGATSCKTCVWHVWLLMKF